MHINLETSEQHTIAAYSEYEIKINSTIYKDNLIISPTEIIVPWTLINLQNLTQDSLDLLLKQQPEIIIIGHNQANQFVPPSVSEQLSRRRIAIESMSIGAACRTFNVLLGEKRAVTLGILFSALS